MIPGKSVVEKPRDPKKPVISAMNHDKSTGAVTFLDVLGWKGIWRDNILDEDRNPIEILSTFIKHLEDKGEEFSKAYEYINTDKSTRGENIVKILSISDTIVLFSSGNPKETIDIHSKLCSWAIENALEEGLLFRGAISYGEYDIKESIMIGPAIDEAAAWHESTNWIGVILTPSAQMQIRNEQMDFIVSYNSIPFKSNIKHLNKCVKWDYKDKEKLYEQFIHKGPHMQEIAPKYLNTLEFLDRNRKKKDKIPFRFYRRKYTLKNQPIL